jgi:hypothetical protein
MTFVVLSGVGSVAPAGAFPVSFRFANKKAAA